MGIKTIVSGTLLGLSITSMAQAASVSLTPQTNSIAVGDNISIDLMVDFSSEPTLGGGIDVFYDSSRLDFVSFTFDSSFESLIDPFMSCPSAGICDPISSAGSIENIAFGNFGGIGGTFLVGTFTFDALSSGQALFSTQANTTLGGPFVSSTTFEPMSVTYNGTSIAITEVPLPAAGWMFLTALTGICVSKRKK